MVKKTYLKYGKALEKKNLGKKFCWSDNFIQHFISNARVELGPQLIPLKVGIPTSPGIWYPSISMQIAVRVLNCGLTTTNTNNFFQFFLLKWSPSRIFTNFLLPVSFSQISIQMIAQSPRFILPFLIHKIAKTSFRPLENCMSAVTGLQTHLICEVHHCHFCHTVASLKLLFLPSTFRGHC